jgi:hypothetical protein
MRPPAHAANHEAAEPSNAAAPAVKAITTALLRAREMFSFARAATSSTRRSASGCKPCGGGSQAHEISTIVRLHASMTRCGQQDTRCLCAGIFEIASGQVEPLVLPARSPSVCVHGT